MLGPDDELSDGKEVDAKDEYTIGFRLGILLGTIEGVKDGIVLGSNDGLEYGIALGVC